MAYVDLNDVIIQAGDVLSYEVIEGGLLADVVIVIGDNLFVSNRKYSSDGYETIGDYIPLHFYALGSFTNDLTIKKSIIMNIDSPKFSEHLELKPMDNRGDWYTIDDFQKLKHEGLCWIIYRGAIEHAYYDIETCEFKLHLTSLHCYDIDHIPSIQPIIKPGHI